jgi:hypothetical protein
MLRPAGRGLKLGPFAEPNLTGNPADDLSPYLGNVIVKAAPLPTAASAETVPP